MNKSMKNKVVSVLTFVMCAMLTLFIGLNVNFAKAETPTATDTNVFTLGNTASIRDAKNGGYAGIRFEAKLGVEKFNELRGGEESIEVVFVADKVGANLPVEKSYTVTADNFNNDSDKVIEIRHTLSFKGLDEAKLAQAYVMDLKVDCYAKVAGVEVPESKTSITQNARSVASFNDLLDGTSDYANTYYETASLDTGVASYVGGSEGVKITVKDAKEGSDVYINTYKVNATINGEVITIAKADMVNLLTTADKNFIQLIDAEGNVVAKELNEEIPVYNGGQPLTFSAIDGDLGASLGDTITSAEVVSNDAVDGTVFNALQVSNNKVLGLQTKRDGWTNAVIKVSTAYNTTYVNLKSATKIIDDAADMDMFAISKDNEYFVEVGSFRKMDGYFVLANDITLDEALVHNTVYRSDGSIDSGASDNTYWVNSVFGFNGVFDGQGFTLTAPIEQKGLFGALGQGVCIKNTRFNIEASIGNSARNASGLFHHFSGIAGGTIDQNLFIFENLWIKVSGESANFSPIASRGSRCYIYNNVFIDLSDLEVTSGCVLGNQQQYAFYNGYVNGLSGIHVVSERPFLLWDGINVVPANMYDSFDGIEYVPGTTTIESGKTYKYKANGVNQYDSISAMMDANVTLPTVDNGDGVVMTSAEGNKIDVGTSATISLKKGNDDVSFTLSSSNANVTVDGNKVTGADNGCAVITATYTIDGKTHSKTMFIKSGYNVQNYNTEATPFVFSAVDGELPTNMLATGETVVSATADNQTLTVEEGKVKGFTLSTDSNGKDVVESALINVCTNKDNLYKMYVKAYTKTIDSAEDMLYFDMATEKTLTGTYIMTKNVEVTEQVASQITHAAVANALPTVGGDSTGPSYGFKGTFDGNGYTLSGYIPTKGYFGSTIFPGVIKNVAIDAQAYVTEGIINAVFALTGGANGWNTAFTMTDVSVKVSGNVTTFAGLFGRASYLTTDSIFMDLSGLTAQSGYALSGGVFVGFFYKTNIYAISTLDVARVTHHFGGKVIASNAVIPVDVEMKCDSGNTRWYFVDTNNVKNFIFDDTSDNSVTKAKGIFYTDLETLLKNQTTNTSYTGYGSTGAQYDNETYWEIKETTVGKTTGYIPVWKAKA